MEILNGGCICLRKAVALENVENGMQFSNVLLDMPYLFPLNLGPRICCFFASVSCLIIPFGHGETDQ